MQRQASRQCLSSVPIPPELSAIVRTRPLISAALLLVCELTPRSAYAHGNLKRSEPAAGAALAQLPRLLRLDFTEAPELAFTRVTLIGPGRDTIPLSGVRFSTESKRSIVADVQGTSQAGSYTVIWQMAGTDGHVLRGRFTFSVQSSAMGGAVADSAALPRGEAAGRLPAPGQDSLGAAHHGVALDPDERSFDASSRLYVAIRWAQFMGLVIVFGAIAFVTFVLGALKRMARPRAYTIAWTRTRVARGAQAAAALVGLSALLRLWAQSAAMHGDQALDPSLIGTMLGQTVWGWGWIVQLAGVIVACVGFTLARLDRPQGWRIAMVGAVILAFTPALSGHAISTPTLPTLAVLNDALHIAAAGGWLGSLFFVVTSGIPEALRLEESARGHAVADLINAFSPTALVFAGITVLSGVVSAWLHLGTLPALWQSQYGQRLLIKLAVLSVVAGTGAYNWLRVRPRLGTERGAARVRRSATVELAVGALVLLVTAVLVATPTATDMAAMNP
ncbi:MAG: CopD family protein [Gemmatimonadaceae bacterium]